MNCTVDDKTRGLLRAAIGEALGGFAARSFPEGDKATDGALRQRIDKEIEIVLKDDDVMLAIKVLKFALEELGPEEFQTITGYDFDFGLDTIKIFEEITKVNPRIGKMPS